ncbi:MAG: adenylosuccinate synthase [Candidatus Caldarchaeum sp.]|nr:adenylosuccinate synthase [Candidatus Caldarchaeum sp.]MCX8200558.1 adenylosuccinate synthase [Candidatus Caldarchaeum sp.]MDW8434623.1 adenylosuccinate synthase [Candidatus Caldarchaeum sp.]
MKGVDVIVGLQWGDEGKGKISYVLSKQADAVVRFQGGANAGHTVKIGETRYKFNMLPAGCLAGPRPVIAAGCLLDPEAFEREIKLITSLGVKHKPLVSESTHIILPHHRELDGRIEELRGSEAVGTTRRGIGPAYADKMLRVGIRAGETTDPQLIQSKTQLLQKLHGIDFSVDAEKLRQTISPFVGNVETYLNTVLESGGRVVLEGAQGTLLDIDHGTYPYVTSSNTLAANGFVSTGVAVKWKHSVIGVMKAYATRVGAGPFPTELDGDVAERIREVGGEYGTTTGRPRRVGWLDIPALRYACMVNGVDEIAVTKVDVLNGLSTVKACVGYVVNGVETESFTDCLMMLDDVKPVYVEFPGWSVGDDDWHAAVRNGWDDLPPNAREYLEWVEKTLHVKISLVSVGEEAGLTVQRT